MSVPFEKAVTEDLQLGHGTTIVTNPAGGTMTGSKINLGRLLIPYAKTFSATPAFDLTDGDYQSMTLTANVTSSTITISSGSLFEGALLLLKLTQDGTGSRTFAQPSNLKGTITLGSAAASVTHIWAIYDGTTNWHLLVSNTHT